MLLASSTMRSDLMWSGIHVQALGLVVVCTRTCSSTSAQESCHTMY